MKKKKTHENISDVEYAHAQTVFTQFNCENMGDYSDLYLKTDVLLLADCFENFRKIFLSAYGLEVSHYYTTAGLSWDAMLLNTGVKLEQIWTCIHL